MRASQHAQTLEPLKFQIKIRYVYNIQKKGYYFEFLIISNDKVLFFGQEFRELNLCSLVFER